MVRTSDLVFGGSRVDSCGFSFFQVENVYWKCKCAAQANASLKNKFKKITPLTRFSLLEAAFSKNWPSTARYL